MVFGLVSGALADIYNTQCNASNDTLYYNYNGNYTHAWVMVNAKQVGDFWEVSSGSNVYQTPLNSGDTVAVYFYSDGHYGYDETTCN